VSKLGITGVVVLQRENATATAVSVLLLLLLLLPMNDNHGASFFILTNIR
jgi:hypothetical protein